MTVRDRMAMYQQSKGLSDYAIEKALGKSKGYWHTCKNPTAGIIQLFIDVYSDISCEWLLRGKGSMLLSSEPKEINILDQKYEKLDQAAIDYMIEQKIEEALKKKGIG